MSPEKRKTESCEDTERRKRHRTTGETDAERNEAGAELPALHDRTAERGILSQSNIQHGSHFDGRYDVFGSLHQGNVINIRQTADRCLADLRVTDPRHDKKRIQDTKGGLLSDCYVWVLDNSEFCQWRDNEDQQLLWVKGDPGKGKTMLLCGIIDGLDNSPAEARLLAYFFCQATDERLNTATAVLRGLIFMLLDQDASLVSHIKNKYDTARKALFEDANAWHALSEIFTNIVQDPKLRGAYIVIDALDECKEGLEQLLGLIRQASSSFGPKWLVSSRNEPHIERRMRSVENRVSLELNADPVSAAVGRFITFKVSQIAEDQGYRGNTQDEVCRYLSCNAEGTFLWAALVCEELSKAFEWEAVQIAESFPPGLGHLYQRMMTQISESRHTSLCYRILALVATAYRPLSFAESTIFIQEWQGMLGNIQPIYDMVSLCGSFLTVREETIYFVHQSAKDFLIKETSDILFPKSQPAIHDQIFSRSVEAMSQTLKRDIYGLHDLGFPIEDVPRQRPDPDPLATIAYSCVYWVNHLIDASKALDRDDSVRDDETVYRFLQGKGLYWIESLSLLRSMSEGMLALERLLRHLQERLGASELQVLVKDAYRLLRTFRPAIESRPLQAYVSALVLSPTKSLMRRLFVHERPPWFECKTELAEQWSACEVTLEGHRSSVMSVAFSPDGRRIVSASHDKTVKLWDANTCACEATLTGHTLAVNSVAFSQDGQRVVSASRDKTIKLWYVETSTCEATLEGHSGAVWSAAFSPDGQHIVSASDDKTVQLWDVQKHVCEATLEGHSGAVRSAAFSPDRQYIVSASNDKTVKLWDIQMGVCKVTLEGYRSSVISAAFSPDRQHFVSASSDETIKLWDVQTGVCEMTLEGHRLWVSSAAFSLDGQRIISASGDETVKLWDVQTGVCEMTLKGHSGAVRSAAFSPDGQHIVSASDDETIKLWDTQTGAYKATLEGHTSSVTSAAFSPDRQHFVSASSDETIKLWDVQTGVCEMTLEGHSGAVRSAAFSPDGQYIVSASSDETIKLWDVQTGEYKATLEGHTSWVMLAAFSLDGQYIVSASDDQTVKLWDVQKRACEATLEGHSGAVWSAAFSPDGQYIVSASEDETVKLWDVQKRACEATLEGHNGAVWSAAFSPDGQYIVSASDDETVKLWDVATSACFRTFIVGYTSSVAFDPTSTFIHTDAGDICIDESTPVAVDTHLQKPAQQKDYSLSRDRAWILQDSKEILWLPPEYRPDASTVCATERGTNLVLCCSSGRVYLFHLSRF